MLRVDWKKFGDAASHQAYVYDMSITALRRQLGLSHSRTWAALAGLPVGTEIFLTICDWMGVDPMDFAREAEPLFRGESIS